MALTKVLLGFLFCISLLHGITCSKVWIVGDETGWDYNIYPWPMGKNFTARDALVFRYDPKRHDLTLVDKAEYDACKKSSTSVVLRSGNDKILVIPGWNYFFSSVSDDCEYGIQMALYGHTPPTTP